MKKIYIAFGLCAMISGCMQTTGGTMPPVPNPPSYTPLSFEVDDSVREAERLLRAADHYDFVCSNHVHVFRTYVNNFGLARSDHLSSETVRCYGDAVRAVDQALDTVIKSKESESIKESSTLLVARFKTYMEGLSPYRPEDQEAKRNYKDAFNELSSRLR